MSNLHGKYNHGYFKSDFGGALAIRFTANKNAMKIFLENILINLENIGHWKFLYFLNE